jgi:hypothetical protein
VQGEFPRSWKVLARQLQTIVLSDNAGLLGCVPVSSDTTVVSMNTGIKGLCNPNILAIEQQQRNAMLTILPDVIAGVYGVSWYNTSVQVGNYFRDAETEGTQKLIAFGPDDGSAYLQVVNGTEYVVSLKFVNVSLNLQNLVRLAQQLPRLDYFVCLDCNSRGRQLPAQLPAAAPYMRTLWFNGCGLAGTLPASWGNWSSLFGLSLSNNSITGTLPESFATLSNLGYLFLGSNNLQGTLPAVWGQAQLMPAELKFDLKNNKGLQGTVPAAWTHFATGRIVVKGTGITGCRVAFENIGADIRDCLERPEASLLALKDLLKEAMAGTSGGLSTWTNGACRKLCVVNSTAAIQRE